MLPADMDHAYVILEMPRRAIPETLILCQEGMAPDQEPEQVGMIHPVGK